MKKGKIHIGTSGWNYKHWKEKFYPEDLKQKDQLIYYTGYFNTVEINNSFYHLPSIESFKNWRKNVPKQFVFSVKASRYITHMKKLKDPEESLKLFMNNIIFLKEKLGPILFQLPPHWKLNIERFESFLKSLPSNYRYTFEFRNISWYDKRVYDLLKKYNCAFCIYELNHHTSPLVITSDFIYVRLHGPDDKYAGNYSKAILRKWSSQCIKWAKAGKDVYVYFDNDQLAYATKNAETLLTMVKVY